MKSEKEVKEMLKKIKIDKVYGTCYKLGYKTALEDVLEIKRPKAKPA